MANSQRPPIGIIPRSLLDESRMEDISAAIYRYLCAGVVIPPEWIEEYNEIANRRNGRN